MSDYATLDVMPSDVAATQPRAGSVFFPSPKEVLTHAAERPTLLTPTVPELSRVTLQRRDTGELRAILSNMCGQLRQPLDGISHMHPNGTPHIPSLVAVWLIGRVSEAYRPGSKLVNLSRVGDPDALRSIGGVTDLLIAAINIDMESGR